MDADNSRQILSSILEKGIAHPYQEVVRKVLSSMSVPRQDEIEEMFWCQSCYMRENKIKTRYCRRIIDQCHWWHTWVGTSSIVGTFPGCLGLMCEEYSDTIRISTIHCGWELEPVTSVAENVNKARSGNASVTKMQDAWAKRKWSWVLILTARCRRKYHPSRRGKRNLLDLCPLILHSHCVTAWHRGAAEIETNRRRPLLIPSMEWHTLDQWASIKFSIFFLFVEI